jgi:hypothetical protein
VRLPCNLPRGPDELALIAGYLMAMDFFFLKIASQRVMFRLDCHETCLRTARNRGGQVGVRGNGESCACYVERNICSPREPLSEYANDRSGSARVRKQTHEREIV